MKKVVFFFPWKVVSGGPFYLCRLADSLAKDPNYEVYYTDYYNSLSDEILTDFRVRKYPYFGKAYEMEIFPDEPITLITPIYWAFVVPKLHPDSKVIFLNWHNACIPDLRAKWKTDPQTIEDFLTLVQQYDGIFFADAAHRLEQNNLTGLTYAETYVPIVTAPRDYLAKEQLVSDDEYNIAILGRLSPDKVYANIELINNIAAVTTDEKIINIHIIGNGPKENLLFSRKYPEHINIIKHDTLPIDDVVAFLGENVDLLFAMGTSALEGASIGVPTIVIPNEEHFFQCNKYVFLHETIGYALGWSVSQIEDLGLTYHSMEDVLDLIFVQNRKAELGRACYAYIQENHHENVSFLKAAMEQCNLRYEYIHPFIRPSKQESQEVKKKNSELVFKAKQVIKKVAGHPVKRYCLFGIPFFTLREVYPQIYNLFFCGIIPLLRVHIQKKRYAASILPLVWIWKCFRRVFKKLLKNTTKEIPAHELSSRRRQRIENKLARNEKIRVCLFEPRISCWQFGNIYHLLENSGIFEPIVVVTPFLTMGDDAMVEYMETTYAALAQQGYRVIKGYDKDTKTFLNIKKELDPDAVFYSMFWRNHFQANSYITNFQDIYTFLYPYGYDIFRHPDRESMNFELQNKVSRYYLPTKIHKGIAEDNMDNHAKNVYITGSPKLDYLLDPDYKPTDVWHAPRSKKRIIWAPHHSLKEAFPYAQLCAFLDLSDFMLELAEKYQDQIHFAFKPHPMLKPRLYELWGKRKTDNYYAAWENGVNTQLEVGEFTDLFLTSDAMILDSISFVAEYTIIDKPAFFTYGKETRFPTNRFGTAIKEVLYRNKTAETLFEDVQAFIDDVVMNGNDTLADDRSDFIHKFMLPKEGKTAAEIIYEDMCRVILNDEFVEYKIDWSDTYEDKE